MVLPLIFVLFSLFFPGSHRFPSEKKNVSSSTTRMLSAVKTSRTRGGIKGRGREGRGRESQPALRTTALGITLLQLHHTGGRGPFSGPLLLVQPVQLSSLSRLSFFCLLIIQMSVQRLFSLFPLHNRFHPFVNMQNAILSFIQLKCPCNM